MPVKSTSSAIAILEQLKTDFPQFDFVEASQFSWHAGKGRISFRGEPMQDPRGIWAIFHELGHALLDHQDYESDVELLHIERDAWREAQRLAMEYRHPIDPDYIEECLDSYRDWLHVRATCPTCYVRCLQFSRHLYSCHNCGTQWRVTRSRLCRPYRRRSS